MLVPTEGMSPTNLPEPVGILAVKTTVVKGGLGIANPEDEAPLQSNCSSQDSPHY